MPRLAIRPYPRQLEERVTIRDGREFELRPIRPADEPLLQDMIARSSPRTSALRFFTPMRQLTHSAAARLTQIDYDREMALVAVAPNERPGDGRAAGDLRRGAHLRRPPRTTRRRSTASLVRSDLKGHGLGYVLMARILDYARDRGVGTVYGEVLREKHGHAGDVPGSGLSTAAPTWTITS